MSTFNNTAAPTASSGNFQVNLNLFGIGLTNEDVTLTLYNGLDEIVHQGSGPVARALPDGLYTVRAEYAGEFEERVVHHKGETDITLRPTRHAAAPVAGTVGFHEYYSNSSRDLSLRETDQPLNNPAGDEGGLFIFIRTSDKNLYRGQDLSEGLSLRRPENGKVFTTFNTGVQVSPEYGFLAYSVKARPGMYVLEHAGEPPRQLPVYVYKGWQTQVFSLYHHRPLLEGATILLARPGAGFDPGDRLAYAIDMAIGGLQNNTELLPQQVMWQLLNDKFDSPMLGLLGAHLLLRRREVNEGTVAQVLDNLNYLLPDSPDVLALRVMAAQRFERPIPNEAVFTRPPMLAAGFKAIIAADNAYSSVIPDGSWVERIAPQLYNDSPWTSWRPLPAKTMTSDFSAYMSVAPYVQQFNAPWLEDIQRGGEASEWVKASLQDVFAYSQKSGQPVEAVLAKFANEFNIPLRLVKRAHAEFKNELIAHPASQPPVPPPPANEEQLQKLLREIKKKDDDVQNSPGNAE